MRFKWYAPHNLAVMGCVAVVLALGVLAAFGWSPASAATGKDCIASKSKKTGVVTINCVMNPASKFHIGGTVNVGYRINFQVTCDSYKYNRSVLVGRWFNIGLREDAAHPKDLELRTVLLTSDSCRLHVLAKPTQNYAKRKIKIGVSYGLLPKIVVVNGGLIDGMID